MGPTRKLLLCFSENTGFKPANQGPKVHIQNIQK